MKCNIPSCENNQAEHHLYVFQKTGLIMIIQILRILEEFKLKDRAWDSYVWFIRFTYLPPIVKKLKRNWIWIHKCHKNENEHGKCVVETTTRLKGKIIKQRVFNTTRKSCTWMVSSVTNIKRYVHAISSAEMDVTINSETHKWTMWESRESIV